MRYLLFILTLLVYVSCIGQNEKHDLSITVSDEQGNGLPESKIKLVGRDTTILSITDFEGNLQVENIKLGKYQVSISSVGYYQLENHQIQIVNNTEQLIFRMKLVDIRQANVEWEGGWVTLESKKGKVISVKSK